MKAGLPKLVEQSGVNLKWQLYPPSHKELAKQVQRELGAEALSLVVLASAALCVRATDLSLGIERGQDAFPPPHQTDILADRAFMARQHRYIPH